MSSSSPLGVFDSGVGGLSILKDIRKLLPNEDLIYLADTAHCPYGVKPVAEIRQRVLEVTNFLITLGAKVIVVACNSASVAGLDQVREVNPRIPIIGVEPAIKPAHELSGNGKIGVLATQMTINGDRFSVLMEKYGTGIEVYTQPAPGLVELVEAGKIETAETEMMLRKYLQPLLDKEIDTLVLGCTHYPFLSSVIHQIAPAVTILDTGLAVARQTAKVLESYKLKTHKTTLGEEIFYTSGEPVVVEKIIAYLWGNDQVRVSSANF